MVFRYAFVVMVSALVLAACRQYPEQEDYGVVCVITWEASEGHLLSVIASTEDCSGDHEGASFECTIEATDGQAVIKTTFQDGDDPDHACGSPLYADCRVSVEPGTYDVIFGDHDPEQIQVPGGDELCIPLAFQEH